MKKLELIIENDFFINKDKSAFKIECCNANVENQKIEIQLKGTSPNTDKLLLDFFKSIEKDDKIIMKK